MSAINGCNRRWVNQNGCVEKPPVNHNKMFIITDFVKELKKQVPGLVLDQSHIYKTVKEIEGILDENP